MPTSGLRSAFLAEPEATLFRTPPQSVLRAFELAGAVLGLVVTAPVLAVVSILILLTDGRPVLYVQDRVGRGGKPFRMLKFRSMRVTGAGQGSLITASGDRRVTRIGRLLRRYKLDELPQLLNVLAGHMSFCGPRPEVARYVDGSAAPWHTVLSVRPGITDLASLLYRDEERMLAEASDVESCYRDTILPEKLRLNLLYLRTRSVWSDLKLIALTVRHCFLPGEMNRARIEKLLMKE